ncbi:hypothetical protein MPRG_46520 [Mycobacterium paragordonae]|uniref:Uncharacterized protein n=1 Tax=Mycobacterium paragordonae TaxID=1389713 RepID=A0ABQ1CAT5_9MYCO|nr:hypothetical protein MPRG_46520 [Mycobacterium paragordonae]
MRPRSDLGGPGGSPASIRGSESLTYTDGAKRAVGEGGLIARVGFDEPPETVAVSRDPVTCAIDRRFRHTGAAKRQESAAFAQLIAPDIGAWPGCYRSVT